MYGVYCNENIAKVTTNKGKDVYPAIVIDMELPEISIHFIRIFVYYFDILRPIQYNDDDEQYVPLIFAVDL